MIKKFAIRQLLLLVLVGLLLSLIVTNVSAQSSLPTVTIKATDPIAKEPSDKGQFTVYRTNSASLAALTVYYSVGGTATNGLDYLTLSGSVTIPAGAISAPISVVPRDDTLREGTETIILTLIPYCPGPLPCTYNTGAPSSATVFVYDND
jgi:hypothetical protein